MTTPFRRGDTVECIRTCNNGFNEMAKAGERFTVSDCILNPVSLDIWRVYFRGHDQRYGFIASNFRKIDDEAEAA